MTKIQEEFLELVTIIEKRFLHEIALADFNIAEKHKDYISRGPPCIIIGSKNGLDILDCDDSYKRLKRIIKRQKFNIVRPSMFLVNPYVDLSSPTFEYHHTYHYYKTILKEYFNLVIIVDKFGVCTISLGVFIDEKNE